MNISGFYNGLMAGLGNLLHKTDKSNDFTAELDPAIRYMEVWPIIKRTGHPPQLVLGIVNEFRGEHQREPEWAEIMPYLSQRMAELDANPEERQAMFQANDRTAEAIKLGKQRMWLEDRRQEAGRQLKVKLP